MRRGALLMALLAVAGLIYYVAMRDGEKDDARVPAPRDVEAWYAHHQSLVQRARQGDVDLLFLGDSLTAGWEFDGSESWKKSFVPLKAANFGIVGDRTQNVLWRITIGNELEGMHPKLVVLMIGTNNSDANSAADIADGVKAIISELRQARPQVKVLLLSLLPRSDKPSEQINEAQIGPQQLRSIIKEINDHLARLADGQNVVYLDISDKFLDANGNLSRKIMPDYLHLSDRGYEIFAAAIEAKVKEMLK